METTGPSINPGAEVLIQGQADPLPEPTLPATHQWVLVPTAAGFLLEPIRSEFLPWVHGWVNADPLVEPINWMNDRLGEEIEIPPGPHPMEPIPLPPIDEGDARIPGNTNPGRMMMGTRSILRLE